MDFISCLDIKGSSHGLFQSWLYEHMVAVMVEYVEGQVCHPGPKALKMVTIAALLGAQYHKDKTKTKSFLDDTEVL